MDVVEHKTEVIANGGGERDPELLHLEAEGHPADGVEADGGHLVDPAEAEGVRGHQGIGEGQARAGDRDLDIRLGADQQQDPGAEGGPGIEGPGIEGPGIEGPEIEGPETDIRQQGQLLLVSSERE